MVFAATPALPSGPHTSNFGFPTQNTHLWPSFFFFLPLGSLLCCYPKKKNSDQKHVGCRVIASAHAFAAFCPSFTRPRVCMVRSTIVLTSQFRRPGIMNSSKRAHVITIFFLSCWFSTISFVGPKTSIFLIKKSHRATEAECGLGQRHKSQGRAAERESLSCGRSPSSCLAVVRMHLSSFGSESALEIQGQERKKEIKTKEQYHSNTLEPSSTNDRAFSLGENRQAPPEIINLNSLLLPSFPSRAGLI